MKYFEIIDKNVAAIFQLQWKIGNISDMFLQYSVLCGSLTTLYAHRIIEFSKMLISNHFLLGLWISKNNVKTYLYVKKSKLFEKKYYFSDRNAKKYSKSKIDFKNGICCKSVK